MANVCFGRTERSATGEASGLPDGLGGRRIEFHHRFDFKVDRTRIAYTGMNCVAKFIEERETGLVKIVFRS